MICALVSKMLISFLLVTAPVRKSEKVTRDPKTGRGMY